MDRFKALDRGTQLMFAAGLLLLIDTFLPWQDIASQLDDLGLGSLSDEFGVQTTASAWNGLFGVLLGLAVILLLARIVVRLAAVNVPLPISSTMTAAVLGILIPFFAVTKAIFQEGSTVWAYIGAVLAVLVGVGAWQAVQEAGGVKTLATELPSMPPTTDASPSAPSPEPSPGPTDAVDTAATTAEAPLETEREPAVTTIAAEHNAEPELVPTSASTPEPAPTPPAPARFCENCGAERSLGTRFCTSCGKE